MNRSSFLWLLVLAALVAAAGYWVFWRDRDAWEAGGGRSGPVLGGFPVNEAAEVRIAGGGGEVTLRRGETGWAVAERGDYPANFEDIGALLRRLYDLKAVQSFRVDPAQLAALELAPPGDGGEGSGTLIDIRDREGRPLSNLLLGKRHFTRTGPEDLSDGVATGRYVVRMEDPRTVRLVGETFDDVSPDPARWLDKDFVRPGPPRVVTLQAREAGKNWTIHRDAPGGVWRMDGLPPGQTPDPAKLLSVDSLMGSLSMHDVAATDDPRAKLLAEDPATVTVEGFDGVRYVFTVGQPPRGQYLQYHPVTLSVSELPQPADAVAVTPEEGGTDAVPAASPGPSARERLEAARRFEGRIYFVPSGFFDPFLREKELLLAEPPPAPAPDG